MMRMQKWRVTLSSGDSFLVGQSAYEQVVRQLRDGHRDSFGDFESLDDLVHHVRLGAIVLIVELT